MRFSHEGACCGDWFLEVFTRRVLSQGHVVISFSDCRADMLHEKFTRGDLACNRGVTLFCRRDMSPQFKLIWIQGTCRADKISSPQQDFSWKLSVHTMTLQHVPSCVPTFRIERVKHSSIPARITNMNVNFFVSFQLSKAFCSAPGQRNRNNNNLLPLTEAECQQTNGAEWIEGSRYFQIRSDLTATQCTSSPNCPTCILAKPVHNDLTASDTVQCLERLPAPVVGDLPTSPENYNGNADGGEPASFDWVVPNPLERMVAVLRVRWVARNIHSRPMLSFTLVDSADRTTPRKYAFLPCGHLDFGSAVTGPKWRIQGISIVRIHAC